ncbi:universal stress protein [Aestuariivirga sp.]|uniref:universal stress protein n=1 Tax=Aestuariivirga sp. TaxID=2650926 RepID=UPI00391948B1
MSIRDILVHLKSHEDWSPHVDYAIGTAKAFSARLRGLATFHEVVVLRNLAVNAGKTLVDQAARDAEAARMLEARFAKACAAAGVEGVFTTAEGAAGEIMPWAARLHDLTIIEQRQPGLDELGFDAAEETALSAGRPVLIVPSHGQFDPSPDHILLAWNGSHIAASALQGALPFIERARKVTVCSGELRLPLRAGSRVPPLRVADGLRRHVAEVVEEKSDVGSAEVGKHLLERAGALGCGMIVMGAYGRSWFSEYVLGGATRHVLRHMTVPVLTGH